MTHTYVNMKAKLTLSTLLVLLFSLNTGTVREVQAQIGFAAGLNYDSYSDVDLGNGIEGTFESSTGYHIGIFLDLAAGPVALRPGVFYRDVGDVEFDRTGLTETAEYDLSLVEVPIDVRFRLPFPVVRPYALAGPVFSFPSSSDDVFDEGLESMYVSGSVGAGIEIAVPVVGIRLFPEARYAFGVNGFIKDDAEIFDVDVDAEDSSRLNAFMLRLGVAL